MPDSNLDSLHYEDFAAHINRKFKAQLNETTTMEIELIAVEDKSPSPRQEQFVLTFRAPLTAPIFQQMFQVHHEQLGSGLIFLVPIGKDAGGVIYEAIFNRPRQA